MSRQLETAWRSCDQERARLQDAMRRIGETFASNLDREALLEIVVETAVDGVGAEARPRLGAPDADRAARAGRRDRRRRRAWRRRSAPPRRGCSRPASRARRTSTASARSPIRCAATTHQARVSGVVSVARDGRAVHRRRARALPLPRRRRPRVSIENVGLHETVERQAVTDELTGLFNRRRFQEAMATEVERARRFEQPLGLVLLDIDDFKRVNDTYGHQQGDLVLREVARVLRETSREIDEPARYGGEELAVVLPGHRPRGRLQPRRARARRDRGAATCRCSTARARCRSPRASASRRCPGSADDMRGAGRRGRRGALPGQARGQEPHGAGRGLSPPAGRVAFAGDGTARRRHPRAPRAQAPPRRRPLRGRAPGARGAGPRPPRAPAAGEPTPPTPRTTAAASALDDDDVRRAYEDDDEVVRRRAAARRAPDAVEPERPTRRRAATRARARAPRARTSAVERRAVDEPTPPSRSPSDVEPVDRADDARAAEPARPTASRRPPRTPTRRGRARGDARVPPGDAGARPALVRAEAARATSTSEARAGAWRTR